MLRIKNKKLNEITMFAIINNEISINFFLIKSFIKINDYNNVNNNHNISNIEKNTKSISKTISQSTVKTISKSTVKTN